MMEEYHEPWNLIDHITNFRMSIEEDQEHLANIKITILYKIKSQFYIEQM